MKRKGLFILIAAFLLTACGNVNENNKLNNKTEFCISEDALDISEVRMRAQSDYDEAKTKYTNLKYSDIKPYCTDMNEVYDISYEALDNYKGITDERDMYDEQMKLIKEYLGNDLEDKYFATGYCDMGEGEYSSFEEFKKDLFDGKQMDATFMAYLYQTDNEIHYAELQLTLPNVFFYKGEVYSAIDRSRGKDGDTFGTQLRYFYEPYATYYVYGDDNRLKDAYQLKDGVLSVEDGIAYMNNFLQNGLDIEGNDNVKLMVSEVEVYKLTDTLYCYRYKITRNIYGLLKPIIDAGSTMTNENMNYDTSEAYMIRTDSVDMYFGKTTRLNEKTTNKSNKIITLDKALYNVSNSIGDNSTYVIKKIEMGYMDVLSNIDGTAGNMTACWIITTENENDKSESEFYVNARSGDINVYSRY